MQLKPQPLFPVSPVQLSAKLSSVKLANSKRTPEAGLAEIYKRSHGRGIERGQRGMVGVDVGSWGCGDVWCSATWVASESGATS